MYITNNKIMFCAVLLAALSVMLLKPVNAQDKYMKEFLKESEFSLQRTQTESSVMGKKGLIDEKPKADISDLVTVDLIDPFENKTIKGTQTDLEPLDDGIDLDMDDIEFQEKVEALRINIENYFDRIQGQKDVNPIELLNSLKITRIVSSPLKYVEIQGKKYNVEDTIKVRVNVFAKEDEFESMLSEAKIKATKQEDIALVEEIKQDALNRYKELTANPETALNIIKVEVAGVEKSEVSFLIDEKIYKILMKR